MGKVTYRVWRLDPAKKAIAPLALDASKANFALMLQRMCRASALGHRHVVDVGEMRLMIAGDAQAPEGQPGVRFRGINFVTAGICVLFGAPKGRDGLMQAPIDREWLDRHLVWTTPEEADADEEGAAETVVMEADIEAEYVPGQVKGVPEEEADS